MTTPDASIIPNEPRRAARPRLFPRVLLSALLMTLAFPPVDQGWLGWIALAPLFDALFQARRPRHAFALAYLFGLTHWGATILWIGTTVAMWIQSPVGWVAWALLTAIKSGWFGLFGAIAWWVGRRTEGFVRVLSLAAAWTVMEWMRGAYSVSMPWSLSGYTQYRYLPLIQAADLAGVYVLSFGLALTGAGLAMSRKAREEGRGKREENNPSSVHSRFHPLVILSSCRRYSCLFPLPSSLLYPLLLLVYGLFALHRSYEGIPIRLALMQPNIASTRATGDPGGERARESALYQAMVNETQGSPGDRPALFLWPESTASDAINDPQTSALFEGLAQETNAFHLVGTGYEDTLGRVYNSAALFAPDGRIADRYDKNWLVPMGEYVPMRGWIPFGGFFHFPGDTTPGASDKVLSAGEARINALICYESVFPILSRTRVRAGANLLVSLTNDSWAGESSQLQQHIAMAVFRAVETRRDLAAAATTGVTCLIEPTGTFAQSLPPYKQGTRVCTAHLRTEISPYVRFGDWFVAGCALGLLLSLWRGRGSTQPSPSGPSETT